MHKEDLVDVWTRLYSRNEKIDIMTLQNILTKAPHDSGLKEHLTANWEALSHQLVWSMDSIDEVPVVYDMFEKYGTFQIDDDAELQAVFLKHVRELAEQYGAEFLSQMSFELRNDNDVDNLFSDFQNECARMMKNIDLLKAWDWTEYMEAADWEEIFRENREEDARNELEQDRAIGRLMSTSEDDIDVLFER